MQFKFLLVLNTWGTRSRPNSVDYGDYDQCKSINKQSSRIDLQYCVLKISNFNTANISSGLGICVPKLCEATEFEKWIAPAFETEVLQINCEPDLNESYLPNIILTIFTLLSLLVIASTLYHFHCQYIGQRQISTVLSSFSLIQNAKTLFNFSDERRDLKCVDGIRTLTMFWLVMYHTFRSVEYYTPAKTNPEKLQEWQQSFDYSFIHYAPLAVDTYLLLGGLLLSYKIMQDREKKREFNYFSYFFHRFLRLTPVLVSTIGFYLLVFR